MCSGVLQECFPPEVRLEVIEDLAGFCGYFFSSRVSNCVYTWLVFGFGLEARYGFEIMAISFRAVFIE